MKTLSSMSTWNEKYSPNTTVAFSGALLVDTLKTVLYIRIYI